MNKQSKIICLCGSTKFYDEFQKLNYKFTMEGYIVLSVGCFSHSAKKAHGKDITLNDDQRGMLENLHMDKIALADVVFIINKNGYIGMGLQKEINYAVSLNKDIKYYEEG